MPVMVNPLPDANRETLRDTLCELSSAVSNLRTLSPGQQTRDWLADYIEWANDAASRLRGQVATADIDRLVWSGRHQLLASKIGLLYPDLENSGLDHVLNSELKDRAAAFEEAKQTLDQWIKRWSGPGTFVAFDTSVYIQGANGSATKEPVNYRHASSIKSMIVGAGVTVRHYAGDLIPICRSIGLLFGSPTRNNVGSRPLMTESSETVAPDEQVQVWSWIASLTDDLLARSEKEDGFSIDSGSPLAGDDRASQPYNVSHALRTSITLAVDHLHALHALVQQSGFLHLAAPATVARGALECAATAVWIASPTSRNERIARALRWNIQDVKDGDNAASEIGSAAPVSLRERRDSIKAVAAERSLPFNSIKDGYTSTSALQAAENFLQSPLRILFPWRLASGSAHGRRWQLLAFAEVMEKYPTSEPGVINLKAENDHNLVLYLSWAAAIVLQGAVALYDQRGTALCK